MKVRRTCINGAAGLSGTIVVSKNPRDEANRSGVIANLRRQADMADNTCLNCGTITPNAKYCSRACFRQRQSRERHGYVTVTCPCGVVFETWASKVARGAGKYCSVACYRKAGPGRRDEFVWLTCPCGVKFEARAWSVAHGRGKHCSRKCAWRFIERKGKPQRHNRPKAVPGGPFRWRLSKFHGMTPDDYAALLAAQDGRCYLCTEPFRAEEKGAVHIEHDHRCCPSGYSCERCRRGLACRRCNMLVGKVLDDPALLRLIAGNLEKAKLEVESSKRSSAVSLVSLGVISLGKASRSAGK